MNIIFIVIPDDIEERDGNERFLGSESIPCKHIDSKRDERDEEGKAGHQKVKNSLKNLRRSYPLQFLLSNSNNLVRAR